MNFCSLTTFGKLKYLLLGLQTHICIFVRSHRQETFFKNVNVLEELATLSFALDHVNYAWLPIHIRDMKSLSRSVKEEFVFRATVLFEMAVAFPGAPEQDYCVRGSSV